MERNNLIVLVFAVFIILAVVIAWLLYRYKSRMGKRKTEIEQLKAGMEGEERERRRIARELHDGVGGILTSVRLNLNMLKQKDSISFHDFRSIEELLHEMNNEVHRTAHNLMPEILEEQDLW